MLPYSQMLKHNDPEWMEPDYMDEWEMGLNQRELAQLKDKIMFAWNIMEDLSISREERYDLLEDALYAIVKEVY